MHSKLTERSSPQPEHAPHNQPDIPRVVVITAPSGAGKTTMIQEVLAQVPFVTFSVSATTRPQRPHETHGVHYYFITEDDFKARLAENQFVEWQEVYTGRYYGTLRSELARIADLGHCAAFDVDVLGALRLKEIFGPKALTLFIAPPDLETLRQRLVNRGTESPEEIHRRMNRAYEEMRLMDKFDRIVVNDNLDKAVAEVIFAIRAFFEQPAA